MDIFSVTGNIVHSFPEFLKNRLEKTVFLQPQVNLPDRHTGTHVGIVFGGATGRVEKAIELYKQGYIDYFLTTGGIGPYSIDRGIEEAEAYAVELIKAGVPDNRVWIESQSVTTEENIKFSMERLTKEAETITGFIYPILITSGFHLKRARALFEAELTHVRRASPVGCNIAHSHWCACPFGICEPRTWRNHTKGCALVAKEAFGLFRSRLRGKI